MIEQLQGFETAAGALETEILQARIADYHSALLDRLCVGGEVVWGCLGRRMESANGAGGNGNVRHPLTRTTPLTLALRESMDWLLGPSSKWTGNVNGAAGEVLEVLGRRGACFLPDLVSATRRLPSDVEEALWLLAVMGRVTSDSMEPLRRRLSGSQNVNGHRALSRADIRRAQPGAASEAGLQPLVSPGASRAGP